MDLRLADVDLDFLVDQEDPGRRLLVGMRLVMGLVALHGVEEHARLFVIRLGIFFGKKGRFLQWQRMNVLVSLQRPPQFW